MHWWICVPVSLVAVAGCAESASSRAAADAAGARTRETGRDAPADSATAARKPRPAPREAATATSQRRTGPVSRRDAESPPVTTVYRRSDDRPRHDDAALAARGIHVYESKRLKLYTDVQPDIARALPPVIDAAYDEWVRYFGPLPPNREGTEYQITGYLMAERERFREAGLLPDDLPEFLNGRHYNDRFWMHERVSEYYRRHLMIHEATHCFMTATRDMRSLTPMWYFEGMAELFGTHRIDEGTIQFRTMPRQRDEVTDRNQNLGRIELIQRAVAEGRARTLTEALALQPRDFSHNEAYAWSWAVAKLLDTHPDYRERFRELGRQWTPRAFDYAFAESFGSELDELSAQWTLFVHNLQHGYDIERAAVEFRAGTPLEGTSASRNFDVAADRGWQSSGVHVEAGRAYEITAGGRITLADRPKPWTSEPQGISFRYFAGRPLGLLLAAVRSEADEARGSAASMLDVMAVGREAQITPAVSGTLYFRVNDSWSELADNRGTFAVEVRPP